MRSRTGFLSLFAALVFLPATSFAQWYVSYEEGVNAIHGEQWQEAVNKLNDAINEKPDSKARARTYGVHFRDYFPYVYRGLAYRRLGNNAKALADFEKEQSQGEIRRASDDKDAGQILSQNLAELKKTEVADERFEQGRKLFERSEYREAIDMFRTVPLSSPSYAAAAKYISMAQAELDKAGPTVAAGRTATSAGARESTTRPSGSKGTDKRRPVKSIPGNEGSTTSEESPDTREAQTAFQEAVQLYQAGMPGQAKRKFLAVQLLDPSYPELNRYLTDIAQNEEKARKGMSAFFEGAYQEAIAQLGQAAKNNNENDGLFAVLALAYATKYLLNGGQDNALYQNAVEAYRKAKRINGNFQLDEAYVSPKIIALLSAH